MSDTLVIILRLNPSDYHSTGVTVDVVRQLEVPRVMLIVNEAPLTFDFSAVSAELEQTYGCEVVAVISHVDEMLELANNDIFARRYPDHLVTLALRQAVTRLVT
jgi:MinD-like ATPase involved in chromosome partitioning or flagellar assembly